MKFAVFILAGWLVFIYPIAWTWADAPTIHRIDTLGETSRAWRINNAGVVVGRSAIPFESALHAYRYDGSGPAEDIGALEGRYSIAYDINETGTAVGSSTQTDDVNSHAFRYSGAGPMQDLGTFGGSNSAAYSINNAGVIVGTAQTEADAAYRAFRIAGAGPMEDLGALGGSDSSALDINENGTIVGGAHLVGDAAIHAFRLDPGGTMQDLGTLGGQDSFAIAINDLGDIVGDAMTENGAYTAFRMPAGGAMQPLDTLASGTTASAYDINNAGLIVGNSPTPGNAFRPVLWMPDNSIIDLNAWFDQQNPSEGSHWKLQEARAINDFGLIVGWGNHDEWGDQSYILDASSLVPEPSLALCGLLAVLAWSSCLRHSRDERNT